MRPAREFGDVALKYGTRIFHIAKFFFLYAKKPTKHSHQTEDTHSLFTSKVIIHKECCAFLAECCTQVQRMLHLVRRVLHLFRRMLRY